MAFRLSAFYFAYFAYTGAYVAYLPLYLSDRQLSAMHIASVLALRGFVDEVGVMPRAGDLNLEA